MFHIWSIDGMTTFKTVADNSTMDHIMKHVMKLTRNLLVLQKAGMCCDVTLLCKDGNIMAHSGMEGAIGWQKSKYSVSMSW